VYASESEENKNLIIIPENMLLLKHKNNPTDNNYSHRIVLTSIQMKNAQGGIIGDESVDFGRR
jgi:hypothetical protein